MTKPASLSPVAIGAPVRNKALRKPVRVTITVCYSTYAELEQRSTEEGRSISNLAAYLLESSLGAPRR